jgi:hypothetical protein
MNDLIGSAVQGLMKAMGDAKPHQSKTKDRAAAILHDTGIMEGIRKHVDAHLSHMDVSKGSAYYAESRAVVAAIVAAAVQRMFEEGANYTLVKEATSKGVTEGWSLFLDAHPEVKAKIEAEKAKEKAKLEEMYAQQDDEDDDE